MIRKTILLVSVLFMAFCLVSCGGSSGGSSSSDPNRLTEDQVTRIVAELNGKQVNPVSLNGALSPFVEPVAE